MLTVLKFVASQLVVVGIAGSAALVLNAIESSLIHVLLDDYRPCACGIEYSTGDPGLFGFFAGLCIGVRVADALALFPR